LRKNSAHSGFFATFFALGTLLLSSIVANQVLADQWCDGDFCIQTEERTSDVIFTGTNKNAFGTVSARVKLELNNMELDRETPLRFVFQANETRELFRLKTEDRSKATYRFWYWWSHGDYTAQHDTSKIYYVPTTPGKRVEVSQSCNGPFSHIGTRQYAIDFPLEIGSAVHAARAGTVIAIKENSNKGGRDKSFAQHSNYIFIQHDDSTIAAYLHLQKDGAEVELGESVSEQQFIGRSGNTGWSTTPHLHFEVFKPNKNLKWQSIKTVFVTRRGPVVCPTSGVLLPL